MMLHLMRFLVLLAMRRSERNWEREWGPFFEQLRKSNHKKLPLAPHE